MRTHCTYSERISFSFSFICWQRKRQFIACLNNEKKKRKRPSPRNYPFLLFLVINFSLMNIFKVNSTFSYMRTGWPFCRLALFDFFQFRSEVTVGSFLWLLLLDAARRRWTFYGNQMFCFWQYYFTTPSFIIDYYHNSLFIFNQITPTYVGTIITLPSSCSSHL